MKYLWMCCLLLLSLFSNGQELTEYRDTTNHFSVGIPAEWRVSTTDPIVDGHSALKLVVKKKPADTTLKAMESFTVNIVSEPQNNVDTVVKKLLHYTAPDSFSKLIDSGSIYSQGQRMVWLEVTHLEPNVADTLFLTFFITCSGKKAYLLNAITPQARESEYKPLFHQIGESFKTGKAIWKERLKIALPGTTKWTTKVNTEVYHLATKILVPENETAENWSLLINTMTMEDAHMDNIDRAIKSFSDAALGQSSKAKTTVLAKENLPKRRWALFKVETPELPGNTGPQSQLYYVIQGPTAFHTIFIAKKEKSLSPAFVTTWGNIFRKIQIVNE